MLDVTVLVGNPKPASRTLVVARTLVETLLDPESYRLTVIDLVEHASAVFDWPSPTMAELSERVASSGLLIVASPTYKASYTGLLKAFLDRYPNAGLAGVVAVPVMTGADMGHAMGPDVHLRPLLVELGASVPTKGLYFVTGEMDRLQERLDAWVATNGPLLTAVGAVAASLEAKAAVLR
ncbi:MAG TPA: NAD(P)H-dependent oxidoreductase [Gryllotalpicola sp.]